MTTTPYGAWPSPIIATLLVEATVSLGDLAVEGSDLVWGELRPNEDGRTVPVRWNERDGAADLVPARFSARSSVHEYGGGAFVAAGDTCWFVNFADQRIWTSKRGGETIPLTAEPDPPRSVRYGDLVVDHTRTSLFAVRERHGVGGLAGTEGVVNDLVWIATDGSGIGVIASGHDFYAAPRLSPDGRRLVFLAWNQPDMPWDRSALYAIDLTAPGDPVVVAGGGDESLSQPRFSPDGTLHYLSDRSGFTSLYQEDGTAVVEIGEDLGGPDWVFGQSSYDFLADGTVVAAVESPLGAQLTHFGVTGRRRIAERFDDARCVRVADGRIAAIVGSSSEPAAAALIDPVAGSIEIVRPSRRVPVDPAYLSAPEAVTVPGARGEVHAIYFPPANPDVVLPDGELPPLVVVSHGGPTSRTTATFNLRIQYLTSRGIGVVDVNYGGSSGFGRAYRQRLDGQWGVVDTEDCVVVARYLAATGRADPSRLAIRGGSAGGYTTLCALTFTKAFAVGASHYGVSDLSALAADTHKFEARYLDRMIGALPTFQAVYDARSPLAHADQLDCPVIFFQGLDDKVVPPSQAEALVGALRARKVPVAYLTFEGEGHGFRRAETIVAVAEAELAFFGAALGFTPAEALPPVEIEHVEALPRRH